MSMEILAPAGSMGMLRAAVFSGANAVYLGLTSFSARRCAGNFTNDELIAAVNFCHARNVKVYVALNTIIYPSELNDVALAITAVAKSGADAIIVQDLAVAQLAKRIAPTLPLHGSTQLSIHSLSGAVMLAKLGFTRVILARELTLAEIEHITKHCGIETEVFIHGALCVSISGQCYMSAFLGGRSGNRGACAGPCRLPFSAGDAGECHLSLKDMSHLAYLPKLCDLGVVSAKIEGRLRTDEYCAAAVNAAISALHGEKYDAQLLQDVFSRSGFTDAYIAGKRDKEMFGIRTQDDTAAAKKALPRLRELYRREFPCVPVDMQFTLDVHGAKLSATDGNRTSIIYSELVPEPAKTDNSEAIKRALTKTGGTPFYPRDINLQLEGQYYLASSEISDMRRRALDALLAKREAPQPLICEEYEPPVLNRRTKRDIQLISRFANITQMPSDLSPFSKIIIPLAQYEDAPFELRSKIYLELPRAEFGNAEQAVQTAVDTAKRMGFGGFTAENIAHINLIGDADIIGGFGLNIANPICADAYASLGVNTLCASVEMMSSDMNYMPENVNISAICYGHMPLMLTRACPMHNVRTCDGCTKKGTLLDRKNVRLPVRCNGAVRTVFNPIPIYMGDKLTEMPIDYAILYFTIETKKECADVIRKFTNAEPFGSEFTRGLYFKGTI